MKEVLTCQLKMQTEGITLLTPTAAKSSLKEAELHGDKGKRKRTMATRLQKVESWWLAGPD